MSTVDSGKANLTPPKQKLDTTDQKRLKEFLANLEPDGNYASPEDLIWECLEEHGYARTKTVFQNIEQQLVEESKKLIIELIKVLDKPANAKLKERFYKFNKQMGETPAIKWKSLPKEKKESESEHKAEDILTMIRQRQQSQ